MKRTLALGLVVMALATAGCSDNDMILGKPTCPDDLVLVAQSVPDAALVPCFEGLPGGWTVSSSYIGNKGTTLKLDSDRAGFGAATFSYRDQCDVSGLGRLPSEQDDVEVYEEIDRLAGGLESTRYFVFDRGCVTARFDFDGFGDKDYAEDLLDSMLLISREDLNANLQTQNDAFEV
jgi:hypothetical protein